MRPSVEEDKEEVAGEERMTVEIEERKEKVAEIFEAALEMEVK